MTSERINEVLKTLSKCQRSSLRQRYGSMPIQYIRHDDDGFTVVQFGADRPVVQKSFWIRKNGKIVYETTQNVMREMA